MAPSDAYSLGAIAFEAVTGKRATPDNVEEFRAAHGHELSGCISSALAALKPDAPASAPNEPIATVGKPLAPVIRTERAARHCGEA